MCNDYILRNIIKSNRVLSFSTIVLFFRMLSVSTVELIQLFILANTNILGGILKKGYHLYKMMRI